MTKPGRPRRHTSNAEGHCDDLWEGELTAAEVAGKALVLLNVFGEVRAYEGRCPHLGSRLSEGDLNGCTLTCAMHLWEFDALTGKGVNPASSQLTVAPHWPIDAHDSSR